VTNTLAPYAAQVIGGQFGHGEDKNTAAQLVSHAILGATLAYINGGDPTAGGSAAVASEAAATYFTNQYKDKKEYQDANGEFQPNLLPEDVKTQIRDLTAGIGAVIGGAVGDSTYNAQLAGVVGQNAVENNYLTKKQINLLNSKLNALNSGLVGCRDKGCIEKVNIERKKLIEEYRVLSKKQDNELKNVCSSQPSSVACSEGIKSALEYNGGVGISIETARNLLKDRKYSSTNTLNLIYGTANAKYLLNQRIKSVDDRANFFGTNNYYYDANNIDIRWFGAAENVTRAPLTGLGADKNLSWMTFGAGYVLSGGPVSAGGSLYEWRAEAGQALMNGGFNNFKNAFNGNYSSTKGWDINQLKSEQKLLQPIHEKYISDWGPIRIGGALFNDIPNIKSYKDRIEFGCNSMGYSRKDGCKSN